MFQKCQYKWNYIPTKEKQDGYQKIISQLEIPKPQIFKEKSIEEKQNIVDSIISKIRTLNIFPIFYFNQEGIKKEILSVINKNNVYFDQEDNLKTQSVEGSLLLDYLFPNLHHIKAGHYSNPSMYEVFYDNDKLKKCLISFLQERKMYNLRTAFFSKAKYIWNVGTNFLPMRAKAIYEKFCPENGYVYDYSAGFGGRMLGALSSKKNYTYIAVQPNTDTYYNLLQLGNFIEKITKRRNSFQIYKIGSEDFIPKEKIDFAFSCPPFYDLEKYSDESTQSIVKYPKYNDWLEYYVRPTVKHCYESLKDTGIYGVDLMNYFKSSKKVYLIQDWIRIAEEEGFYLRKICKIITRTRKRDENDKQQLLIFTKTPDSFVENEMSEQEKEKYRKRIAKIQYERILKQKIYCRYNIHGELENTYDSIEDLAKESGYSIDEIQKAIRSKKRYNQYIFKVYSGNEEILLNIEYKKVFCKIDNKYFDSYAEAGRYLNVSRQAVQQSHKRKSQYINNIKIQWL